MPRASKFRKSHSGSKKEINNHQVCVASTIDELAIFILKLWEQVPYKKRMELIDTFEN